MAAPGLARAQAPPPAAAPTIDSVTPDERSLIVHWLAPAGVDAADISAYDVRSIESDAPDKAAGLWTVVLDAWSTGAGDLHYLITGLTNDTQYDVQVRAVTMDGEGSWSATVTGTPADHSGAIAGATALALDSTATGVIEAGGDKDFFKIVLSSATDLWLYTSSNLNTAGVLYGADGEVLRSNINPWWPDWSQDFEIRNRLGRGTYYVSVRGRWSSVTGPYTLHARTAIAPGGSIADATDITLGAPAAGRINAAGDRDVFKLVLTSAADLYIAASGYVDTFGELLDANGYRLAESDDSGLRFNRRNFAIWRAVEPGTYYVRVRGCCDWARGPYTLHTVALPPPGDSIASAEHTTHRLTPVRLAEADDEHYFAIGLSIDFYVNISAMVTHRMLSPNTRASLAAEILDQDGNPVDISLIPHSSYIAAGFGSTSFSILDELSAGTHYLRIWSPSGEPGEYLLLLYGDSAYTKQIRWCTAKETPISDPLSGCQWHLRNSGQYPGGAGQDINVEDAWTTTRGAGVNVAVVDNGMHFEHEDLTDNVDPARNRNYSSWRRSIFDPYHSHGTNVAGLIAARDNDIGMRGVAPRATIYGYDIFSEITDANIADAMFRMGEGSTPGDEDTAVSNNSWGPRHSSGPAWAHASWETAVQNGVTSGNHGKGIFYVLAAGNGHQVDDNANLNEHTNYYAVTAVCSVNYDDERSSYSETGANLWICAPSNGAGRRIATTHNGHLYTTSFGGTSAAAPIVSGVAALLRSADDSLTWRDLKLILAASARKNDEMHAGWAQGALEYGSDSERYFFNHEYGFGMVDAGAAVALAGGWTKVPALREISAESEDKDLEIPDRPSGGAPITVCRSVTVGNHVGFTEFVEINTRFDHGTFRDLQVELVSPSGAVSTLAVPVPHWGMALRSVALRDPYRFGSARHLGENAAGEWTLCITDRRPGGQGTLEAWSLTVYGHGYTPGRPEISALAPAVEALTVEWSAPADIGGSAVTAYDLRYIESNSNFGAGANWTVVEGAWTSGALEYTVGGLDFSARRDVQVRAVNDAGPSRWSATAAGAPVRNEPPFFPAGLTTTRSVAKNTGGSTPIGAPVTATDPEGDTLVYTLSGLDADLFTIESRSGQIRVAPDTTVGNQPGRTYAVEASATDPYGLKDRTFVIIGVTDQNEAPVVSGLARVDYAEQGTADVAIYSAEDPEHATIAWSLEGTDGGDFRISDTGVLGFEEPPDFESPADSGEDNEYLVRVRVSDGVNDDTLDVTVTVTNEEEAGTLTLSSQQPLVGTLLTATLDDPDGDITSLSWTWERSLNRSTWSEITGATSASYTPLAADDLNHYLQVTVEYTDGHGSGKSLAAVTHRAVEEPPPVNYPPVFADPSTTRSVAENSAEGATVGEPVTATDDNNDTLSYTLTGRDVDTFSVDDSTGQIRVKPGAALDYEDPNSFPYIVTVTASDPSTTSDSIEVEITVDDVNEAPEAVRDDATTVEDMKLTVDVLANDNDPDAGDPNDTLTVSVSTPPDNGVAEVNADRTITYAPNADFHGVDTFTYQATDAGGLSGEAMVVVTVDPVNDAPVFAEGSAEREVYAGATADTEVGDPVEATDPDGDILEYALSGIDASSFVIDSDTGQITIGADTELDPEVQETYLVTVTASDGTLMTPIEVTITVTERPAITTGGGGSGGPSGPSPSELDFEWNVKRDLEALDGGHDTPTGAWSDGTTLWVLENGDGAGDAIYAYDLNTGERLEEREFELDERNRAPRGVWSGGTVIWVSDSGQDRLFGHDLETGERLPERDLELDEDNGAARGIWSDGERMWVLDGGKDSLFAYDLGSGALVAEYALDDANGDPHGIWSDGVTIWVSDHGAKRLFAYRLEDGELVRNSEEEFTELSKASNNSPRGIWSDGEVIYVADESDDKVYSYNMPDAIDARLASLTLSGIEIGEFSGDRTEYDGVAAEGVTETTVEAEALQRRTTVLIEPADAGGDDTNGHQLALEGIDAITVTVTSADGSRTRVYRVRLGERDREATPEPWPECLRGDIAAGFSTVVYAGGGVEELEACARGLHVTALYVLDEGEFVSYILGAPAFVNQPFVELFADGVPPVMPLVAASKGPPPAADGAGARLAALTLSGVAIGEFSGERTQYAGAAGEGVTQTTVGAAAVQHTARVLIEPADGDGDAANGHQVGLEEGAEIVVTVTSQDGSRTRVYRVWVGSAKEEWEPAPGCLRGGIAAGFSLVVYEGGGVGQLEACARSLHVSALYVLDEGVFVSYILGAPEFVNRPFHELFPHGLPPLTPLVAASDGP